jgi:hypothetical protein
MENCNGQRLVQKIEKTELIGNSLDKINNNFSSLDTAVCEMQTNFAWSTIPENSLIKVNESGNLVEAVKNVDYLPGFPPTLATGILKRSTTGKIEIADTSDFVKPNTNVTFNNVLVNTEVVVNKNITCPKYVGKSTFSDEVTFLKPVVAPNYVSLSDKELKKNIKPLENSLEKISKINGVNYEWKINSVPDVGVIAQEVREVLPEAVYNTSNEFLGVTYVKLIPLLIESVKELKQQVEDLKRQLEAKS